MQRYLIIIEQGKRNYSAYVPDLPGCVATGKTLEELKANMSAAIEMHLQGMLEDHEPIPVLQTLGDYRGSSMNGPGNNALAVRVLLRPTDNENPRRKDWLYH